MACIAVAGGGIAGLACAWRLQAAGHDVEVLEREAVPGGRMRSERVGEFRVERGAQFIASGYRRLHRLVAELGLAGRVRPLAPAPDAFLRGGRLELLDATSLRALARSRLLSPRARLRTLRLGVELARRWRQLDPLAPERAAAFDREDLASGLRRLAGEEACEALLVPAFSATFDSDPEQLSLAFALTTLRLMAGGFALQTFDAGTGLLTRELAARLPVRTGCEVVSVETASDGARVRYREGGRETSLLADAAVVALPGSEVAAVCPKLTPAERGFFERVHYARGIVVHLMLEREPPAWRFRGVSFPRGEGLELYGLAVDHGRPGAAPRGAGLVNAALTERAAARMWDASDASVADLALENLAYTPLGRVRPVGYAVHRWPAMLPQFRPGYLAHLARFRARSDRSPRLAFAGDYLVGPFTEAAVASGERAAREVGERSLGRREP